MDSRPNILFVFTDQHPKHAVGPYGDGRVKTPTLQRFADEGVLFENAYTTCPVCSPARASVQTGLYPNHHGMQTNIFQHGCMVHELPDTPSLLSRRLTAAGYQAGYTGKWHLGYGKRAFEDPYYIEHRIGIDTHRDDIEYPDFYRQGSSLPTDLGYQGDDFPGHGGGGHLYPQYLEYLKANGLEHTVERASVGSVGEITSGKESAVAYFLTERAIARIDAMKDNSAPFFLMLNFWGPHAPAFVPTEYLEPYREARYEPWPSFNEDQTNKPRIHNAKRNNGQPWEDWEIQLRYSYAFADFIDDQIGRVVKHLEDSGLYENTAVIFSADHGDSQGIHNCLSDKSIYLYEETTSIPLIVRLPDKSRAGDHETRFANLTDVYSTVLDLAGVPAELHERDGRSLLPLVRGDTVTNWPETVVTESSGIAHCLFTSRMIRKGNLKYVFNCGDLDELYNLDADPHELRNLAVEPDSSELLTEMQNALVEWMKEKKDGLLHQFQMLRVRN